MKKKLTALALALALALGLAACGGSKAETTAASAGTEAAAETTTAAAPETTAAKTEAEAEETTAVTKAAPAAASEDVGKWTIYEYEANGNKVSHDMLVTAGMGNTYLELYEDGTGKLNLFQSLLDITWKPGEITVYGTSKYTYEIDGDTLNMDMQGVYYTMVRDGSAGSGASSGSSTGAKGSLSP